MPCYTHLKTIHLPNEGSEYLNCTVAKQLPRPESRHVPEHSTIPDREKWKEATRSCPQPPLPAQPTLTADTKGITSLQLLSPRVK